jgi:hypothetical protein
MPKVRMVAPGADKDGNVLGVGTIVDVDDETAAALKADGKASLISDEEEAEKRAQEGVYDSRTSRQDTAGPAEETAQPKAPKAPEKK